MTKNGEQDIDRLGPLRMPLSTDDALRGAMQTPLSDDKPKKKRETKKKAKKRKAKRKKEAAP